MTMKNYEKGMIVTCYVTGITNYGIFVKLDNVNEGLIHISSVSNYYVKELEKFVSNGELIRAKVVSKNGDGKYALSIKNLDYRITKGHHSKIQETAMGFDNLAKHLDYWIYKELKNIKKNDKL